MYIILDLVISANQYWERLSLLSFNQKPDRDKWTS
jgi:hypothetical protein